MKRRAAAEGLGHAQAAEGEVGPDPAGLATQTQISMSAFCKQIIDFHVLQSNGQNSLVSDPLEAF